MLAAVTEKLCLQLIDEGLRQRFHRIGQDRINAKKMISGFNDIIDLDVFAGGENSISLVQHLDLIAGQTIDCHASAAVDHVDLQILIKATILLAVTLLENLLEKRRDWLNFFFFSGWLFGVFRDKPCPELLICIGDSSLGAVSIDHAV